ncbi:MAG: hypothetical protein GF308_13865 [Candidatus Heimdallarchaeota archaeon]|nr:hypothetical protein [Candidatus Heimdallarchaeota archaeon]
MSRDSKIDELIDGLTIKRLDETEFSKNRVVYSKRTAFVYGDETKKHDPISIELFLLDILAKKGPVTRGVLVELTNIPRTTLYDVLSKLIRDGKVIKKPFHNNKRGRPKVLFDIKTD